MTVPYVAIVDDDAPLCSSLVDLMNSTGYRAEPFASAEIFLASKDLCNWDCIVADVDMPGIGGLGLVRELRDQRAAVPVILITAGPDKALDAEAISTGALCLLRKPFEIRALLNWVEIGHKMSKATRPSHSVP